MHMEKYKAHAVSGVTKHNERTWEARGYERANIDNARIGDNYNLAPERGDAVGFVRDRIASLDLPRAPRKDAVMMVEWVATLPEGEADERGFFASLYRALASEYGEDNVVAAWVHKDEPGARPHMHFDFVPVTGDGRLSAKSIMTREHLRTIHERLQVAVSADLGRDVRLLLPDEDKGGKQLSHLSHDEYAAAKDELARARQEAADAHREAARAREELADVRGAKAALEAECEALREQNTALEAEVDGAYNTLAHIVDGLANVLGCWSVGKNVRDYAQGVVDNLDNLLARVEGWYEEREQARAAREAAVVERRAGLLGRKVEQVIDTDRAMTAAVKTAREQLSTLAGRIEHATRTASAVERPAPAHSTSRDLER